LATAVVLLGAGALSLRLRARRRPLGALAALCLGWFAAAVTITGGGFAVEGLYSAKDAAAAIARVAAADAPVFTVQDYYQSLPFYLRHTVTLVDYHDEFTFGLERSPQVGIPDLATFATRWQELPAGYALMTDATRERLATDAPETGAPVTGASMTADFPMRVLANFPGRIVLISRR
jgi:hypothetical protein